MGRYKQQIFIYQRREIVILILLGLMVTLFTFTLGLHLGKRVAGRPIKITTSETSLVKTVPHSIPNRQEFKEKMKEASLSLEDQLREELHSEVTQSGIQIKTPRQVDLPEHPKSANAGATTLKSLHMRKALEHLNHSADHHSTPMASAKTSAKDRVPAHSAQVTHTDHSAKSEHTEHAEAPKPRKFHGGTLRSPTGSPDSHHLSHDVENYALQIGSHPSLDEANQQITSLAKAELKPYLRETEIKGKGKWYRVYLGQYSSREAAQQAGEKFQADHQIASFVVSKVAQE